ncbi:hypothetical protein FS935_02110 [Metabacillus litoralis]|uniref:4-hydroxybenzoate synthetase n=1 Tax=Metabacillus litoralis TaxID=152268 RepID=A0A5C6W980_9BACI|nr:hypothetical protein FS935_02110 [Metabacillus litoralis]
MEFDYHVDRLLESNEKTTDMLEELLGNPLSIKVLCQRYEIDKEIEDITLYRESVMIDPQKNLIVSQNFVRLFPKYIPRSFYYNMIWKRKGIGHYLNQLNIKTSRLITSCGFTKDAEMTNHFQKSVRILFHSKNLPIPFKKYDIYFDNFAVPGFSIIEYFNPEIFSGKN